MSKLTTERRKSLKKSEFALPADRAYPLDTHNRAANAKARASQQEKKGNISESTKEKIFAKANKVLKKGK